jgi:hypothetical protein
VFKYISAEIQEALMITAAKKQQIIAFFKTGTRYGRESSKTADKRKFRKSVAAAAASYVLPVRLSRVQRMSYADQKPILLDRQDKGLQ